MGKITFLVTKGETTYDMSELVESVTWSGRKGSPARTLSVSLIDDDGWKHARSGIDVTKGNHCVFYWEGAELFRGIIMQQRQSTKKTMTIKAYDVGIYLSNNKDSFCYKQKKASEIFKDCCDRFQIPYKDVADTGYVISELPKAKTTACDVILDALSLTFKATGIRHYVTSADGKLSLIKRKDSILQWVVETGRNLISYDYTCSIEKVKTRIKLLSKEDKVLAEKADTELEKTIGIMQDISTPDSISNSDYVDEDTHTFKGNYHSMRLTMNMATDTERSAKASDEKSSTSHSVGDKVQFSGGPQYVASTATSPTNSPKAGPAKITAIAKSKNAKHPYHIIHTDKQSTVYGWVDASQIG